MDAPPIVAGRAPASGLPVRFALFGDERLARLVGSGSERAFAAIYKRYHQPLYRYCRSIVRDDAAAQDALQSTLASAFVALKRGQRDAPLRPWLFRIAHNEAISLIRRVSGTVELTDAPEQCVGSAEDRAGERMRLALLIADLLELPERQRGALVMRELSGLSHEEIAVALGTSVGTAKQAIFEARRALMEFAEGRSMVCEDVRRTVSDGDGRALRGRRVRAHLRDCAPCAAFAAAIPARRDDLQGLVPVLAPVASGAMLARVIGAGSDHAGGGGAGAMAAGAAGKTVAATWAAKTLLGAAMLVTAAGSVTVVQSVLAHEDHAIAPAGVHRSGTTLDGLRGSAVQSATGARGSEASGLGASNARDRALGGQAASRSSNSAQSADGVATGSRPAHGGVGDSGLPSQAQGTRARSVAGVGRHVGASAAPVQAATHKSAAGGSHSSGTGGSHAAAGGDAGSPPGSARATHPASSAGVTSVPGGTRASRAPSSSKAQIAPSAGLGSVSR